MKFPVRIDQNIFFFQNVELFVRNAITKYADLCHIFIHACALNIEKNVLHVSAQKFAYIKIISYTGGNCKAKIDLCKQFARIRARALLFQNDCSILDADNQRSAAMKNFLPCCFYSVPRRPFSLSPPAHRDRIQISRARPKYRSTPIRGRSSLTTLRPTGTYARSAGKPFKMPRIRKMRTACAPYADAAAPRQKGCSFQKTPTMTAIP